MDLIEQDEIRVDADGRKPEEIFLDELRVGLRIRPEILELAGPVDLRDDAHLGLTRRVLDEAVLLPGHFYIAKSRETFSLPNNIMGILNTRSKYARLSLELARSSVYVIPGFGWEAPAPFVFEIAPAIAISGLTPEEAYGFLLLFEFDHSIKLSGKRYDARFPIHFGNE